MTVAAHDMIEPLAVECLGTEGEKTVQLSMAISLKRIADALTTTNQYGEFGSEAIANSIWRGLQDGYRPS